ncbi:MAG: FHA domain-containing protein [Pseudomonadota bacterium]
MPKLILKFKEAIIKEFPLDKDALTIGRTDDNDLKIDNMAVSGHHAKLIRENGDFVLIDLNSLNGTYVNGQKVSKWILKNNDLITVGKHTIIFQDERAAKKPLLTSTSEIKAPEGTVMLDVRTQKRLLEEAAALKPSEPVVEMVGAITFISGGEGLSDIELSKRITTIGKSEDADIKIKGLFLPPNSAVFSRRSSGYFIAHSEGWAVPKVNGIAIKKGQVKLKDGDMIEIGGLKMQFYLKRVGE